MPSSKPDTIHVFVKLYSVLRHRDGAIVDRMEMDIPAGSRVADVLRLLKVAEELEPSLAINSALVREDAPLADGDTLAIIPSVAGG